LDRQTDPLGYKGFPMKMGAFPLLKSFNRAECAFFGGIFPYLLWKIRLRLYRPQGCATDYPELCQDDPRRILYEIKTTSGWISVPYDTDVHKNVLDSTDYK
jgi:hypothetical protein